MYHRVEFPLSVLICLAPTPFQNSYGQYLFTVHAYSSGPRLAQMNLVTDSPLFPVDPTETGPIKAIKDLIGRMTLYDPEKRASIAEIVSVLLYHRGKWTRKTPQSCLCSAPLSSR